MSSPLILESNWANKYKYEDAEKKYFESLSKGCSKPLSGPVAETPAAAPPPPLIGASNMPAVADNKPEPSPPADAPAAPGAAAVQDKKKKRRKKNNSNASAADEQAKVVVPAAPSALQQQQVTPAPQQQQQVPKSSPRSSAELDKKQQPNPKDKKNEVNKKGKKQSPEPEKGPSPPANNQQDEKSSLASEVAKARQHIKSSLECVDRISNIASNQVGGADLVNRIVSLEKENEGLRKLVEKMQKSQDLLEKRLNELEKKSSSLVTPALTKQVAPVKPATAKDDNDDVDLFGSSDEEDDDAKKVREQRLAEYAAKKAKKPALIAKSNVILDVKPWDDETDMKELEKAVRTIEMDGLLWGASKLVPLAFGIHKLQISAVIEDDKVSVDILTENIESNEDYVQSVDIAAFNKI